MKRFLVTSFILASALAIPASADTVSVGGTLNYNYSATTPGGTITANVVYAFTALGQMTVTVTNTTGLAGGGTGSSVRPALTAVGFVSVPTLTPNTASLVTSANISDWHMDNGTGLGNQWTVHVGDPGTCNQGVAPGTSNSGAICAGQTGTFSFSFSPGISSIQFDSTVVKFQTTGNSFEPTGTPGDPVPEPASLVLLGSGLLGAAGVVRRKLKI